MKDWNVGGNFLASRARFAGRRDQIAELNKVVNDALQWEGTGQGEYRILNWTGPSGIGKSALCDHMATALEEARQGGANISWAHIRLTEGPMLTDPVSTMVEMRSQLGARGALSSPLFAYGLTMWSALAYPGADIRARYPELFRASHGEVTDDVLSWVGDLAKEVFEVGSNAVPGLNIFAKYGRRILNHAMELQERQGLEVHINDLNKLYAATDKSGLREVLPMLLGEDIRMSMAPRPKPEPHKLQKLLRLRLRTEHAPPRFVMLVDAYDKAQRRGENGRMEIDLWLEQLAIHARGSVMALFGREGLQWKQDDRRWAKRMQQLTLPPLSFGETGELLGKLNVPAGGAHRDIYEVSQGHPRVARICSDIFHVRNDAGEVVVKDDYDEDAEAALMALVGHLPPEKQQALMVLSVPQNGVSEELFAKLVPSASRSPLGGAWKDLVKMSIFSPMDEGKRYRLDDFVSTRLLVHLGKTDMPLLRKASRDALDFYKEQIEAPGVTAGDVFAFYSHLDQADRATATAWLEDHVDDLLRRGDWLLVQAILKTRGEGLSPSMQKAKVLAEAIRQFHDAIMQGWDDNLKAGLDTFKALRLAVATELDEISFSAARAHSQVRQSGRDRTRIIESWARSFLVSLNLPKDGEVEDGGRAKWAAAMMVVVHVLRQASSEPSAEVSEMLESVRAKLADSDLWPLAGWHMEAAIQKAREGHPEDAELLFEQAACGPFDLPSYTSDLILFHRCENLMASGRSELARALCDKHLEDISRKGFRITGFIVMMRAKAKFALGVEDCGLSDTELAETYWQKLMPDGSPCVLADESHREKLAILQKSIIEKVAEGRPSAAP